MPEIKNDRVHLNINLPLKSKSSLVEVYLRIIYSSFCSTAWGEVRIPTNPMQTLLHGSKWTRRERAHPLEELFTILIMAHFGPWCHLLSWEAHTHTVYIHTDMLMWTVRIRYTLEHICLYAHSTCKTPPCAFTYAHVCAEKHKCACGFVAGSSDEEYIQTPGEGLLGYSAGFPKTCDLGRVIPCHSTRTASSTCILR